MNTALLCGRLTRDPETRYSTGDNPTAVARFTLAVDRRFAKRDDPNAQTADFISCIAFGRQGEFVDKYLRQGTKILLRGHIQTGSYTNKDGVKVYTTDVIADEIEFAESKAAASGNSGNTTTNAAKPANKTDDFVNVPDSLDSDELPFA